LLPDILADSLNPSIEVAMLVLEFHWAMPKQTGAMFPARIDISSPEGL
jgi:hypothetical protein